MSRKLKYSPDDPKVLALKRAIKRMGGLTEVGRIFGVSAQAVYKWEIVSAERMHAMALVSGIPVQELRPDLYEAKPREKLAG